MTIKKLFNLSLGIIALIAILTVFVTISMIDTQKNLQKFVEYQRDAILLANTMSQSSEDLTNGIRQYAMTGDVSYRDFYFKTLDISDGKAPRQNGETISFAKMVEDMNLTDDEEKNILLSQEYSMNLVTLETEVMNFIDNWLNKNSASDLSTTDDRDLYHQQVRLFNREYMDEIAKIMGPVTVFQNLLFERVEKQVEKAEKLKNRMMTLFIISICLMIIVVLIVFITTSRRVLKVLGRDPGEINSLLIEIEKGNLDIKFSNTEKESDQSIYRVLENTVNRIISVISSAQIISEKVDTSSKYITDSAQSLSSGASEQAASTEEISSSMEELAANIQQNLDNSKNADSTAQQVSTDAEKSQVVVNEAVEAIRIIAEKITVIEDISRNTNMLALNAAIEAARAGDAGKGFAVVAAEVRKLAENSQKAAAEIMEISTTGVEKVETSGEYINSIIPEMKKTAQLVQEITNASEEQNNGAEQVNGAIQQMNGIIQENASSSEEMAALSEEMKNLSGELNTIVSFFTISGSSVKSVTVHKAVASHKEKAETEYPNTDKIPESSNLKTDGGFKNF